MANELDFDAWFWAPMPAKQLPWVEPTDADFASTAAFVNWIFGIPNTPDPVAVARQEYEAAKLAHDAARAEMLAHTRARGNWRHDKAELKAVDALHKAMGKKYDAWWRLAHPVAA